MALPPLIEALISRTQYGVGKINARSRATSAALQPFAGRVGQYYAPIQSAQQALGGSLTSSLTQQGQQLGSDITGSLQGIQAPSAAVQQFGAGTAATGAAAGQAVGALSSADLQRLQSQGTAEQIYAAALPRLAELAADQDRRAFLADAAQQLSELSAQQAQTNVENQRYAAEQARQARLDRQDVMRYRAAQKQKKAETAYEHKRAHIKDVQIATALQAATAGKAASQAERNWVDQQRVDIAKYNALTSRQQAGFAGQRLQEKIRYDNEQIRHHKWVEAHPGKSTTKKGGVDYADIVASARDLAKPVENPKTLETVRPPKASVSRRLRAEFPGATPKQIQRALVAAGYY